MWVGHKTSVNVLHTNALPYLKKLHTFKLQHAYVELKNSGYVVVVVRVVFSKPRIGPPSANHGPFTVKPSSCHMHSTLQVTPPTSLSHSFC